MKKNDIKKIIELGRFRFLAGGFFLYTMGCLLALTSGVDFSLNYFLSGYAIMMPAHLSLSYSNNYFDIKVDKYNKPISISGGTKVLIENPHLIQICKYVAITLMIISISIAIIFVFLFSFPLLLLAFIVFGNLLGWFYTAPPFRLAYHGLGEIANMINMGILMPGIGYWIMKGNLDLFFLVFSMPFLLYGLHFMIIVETPDMEGDRKGKKTTLIVKKGRKFGYKISIYSLLISSLYYLLSHFIFEFTNLLYFPIVYILSLFPLFIAVHGWFKEPFKKKKATIIAQRNMSALISFIFMINIYLFASLII